MCCHKPSCRAPQGSSISLTVPDHISQDLTECPDDHISVIDPYSRDMLSGTEQEWVLCPSPAADGEKSVFQSFLNVIKLTEKTGWDNYFTFQANYSVTKETNLERKMLHIRTQFEGDACTEVTNLLWLRNSNSTSRGRVKEIN